MTLRRIVNNSVFHAVQSIAGFERGSFDSGNLTRGNVACGIREQRFRVRNGGGEQMSPVAGRRAGDDAVIVGREALSFHKSLPAAVRAGAEIGPARAGAIERPNDRLGFVDRTSAV